MNVSFLNGVDFKTLQCSEFKSERDILSINRKFLLWGTILSVYIIFRQFFRNLKELCQRLILSFYSLIVGKFPPLKAFEVGWII